jgi:hypothetical protein
MQYRTLLFGFSCGEKGCFNAALIYINPEEREKHGVYWGCFAYRVPLDSLSTPVLI